MWQIGLFHGPALMASGGCVTATTSSWRRHVDLGGKAAATTEQCCPGCRSIDGLYFAIPVLDRAYRMLDSTVGGWVFKFRVRFCQERRGFGKQAGNLLGLAVRLLG